MTRKKYQIKVVKVPLSSRDRPKDNPQIFPRMPQLYLELLENKTKVRPGMENTDYIATSSPAPHIKSYNSPDSANFKENFSDNYSNDGDRFSDKLSDKFNPPKIKML